MLIVSTHKDGKNDNVSWIYKYTVISSSHHVILEFHIIYYSYTQNMNMKIYKAMMMMIMMEKAKNYKTIKPFNAHPNRTVIKVK